METYIPEIWQVKKDNIYDAIHWLKIGVSNSEDLIQHIKSDCPSTNIWKNFIIKIEGEIVKMNECLENLKNCKIDE